MKSSNASGEATGQIEGLNPYLFPGPLLLVVVYLRLVYVLCCCLHGVIKHDDDDDDYAYYVTTETEWVVLSLSKIPLKGRGVNWLHFAIQV